MIGFQEKPGQPTPIPGSPDVPRVDGRLHLRHRRAGPGARGRRARSRQHHDFGKDIIPALIHDAAGLLRTASTTRTRRPSKYWRDIGTLDAYFEANMDLCQVNPEFNLYDPEWPLRTLPAAGAAGEVRVRRRGPPLRPGARLGHLARLHRLGQHASTAACSARTCASTASATIEQCILMPGVRVGRHARIRRAIIDRDVLIPRGALIGYNAEEDRRRHTVTDGGVVVVTADDEPFIGPLSEDGAARSKREADRRGRRGQRTQ